MPRRERDRELARRRKRKEERKKLRAKGLLEPTTGGVKEVERKKAEKPPVKEAPEKSSEKAPSEGQSS
jgi:hypothetical protein